ncbi:hypothetical protein AB1Y20_011428 [Prymnesium parvum]|uniref:Uncharacterized protein n=1 Tax=Prymnesium parvum TaxID=97485 RepID=A0AB34IMV3_PRYPA
MVLLRVAQGATQFLALIATNLSDCMQPITHAHSDRASLALACACHPYARMLPSDAPQARDDNRAGVPASAYERSSSAFGAIVPMNMHNGQRTYARMEQTKLSIKQIRTTDEMIHSFPRSRVSYGCAPSRFPTERFSTAPSSLFASLANASPKPRLNQNAPLARVRIICGRCSVFRALPHALFLALRAL